MCAAIDPVFAAQDSTTADPAVAVTRVDAGGVFGSLALSTNINLASRHWTGALRKMRRDAGLVADCPPQKDGCKRSVRMLSRFIHQAKGKPIGAGLLDDVNLYTNRNIRYTSDRKVFGRNEYWAGPSEVMGARGDCEDYVITKYFILSKLGVADKDMKVVVVRDLVSGQGHAVLAVTIAGRTLILDNQSSQVRDHLTIARYQPLYTINRTSAWLNLAVKRVPVSSTLAEKTGPAPKSVRTVRVADFQSGIIVHLAKRKPLKLAQSDADAVSADRHF